MAGRLSESEVAVLELEIPEFHGESALFGVDEPVDFRLADWLLKGDAGEHFKRSGAQDHLTQYPSTKAALVVS